MTIGSRIKNLRKNLNWTARTLANETNLHPVSIRKYETDRMTPQKEQLEKLAIALKVRPYVISKENYNFSLETFGDLYGLFIMLNKAGIITISKNENDIISLELNEQLKNFLTLRKQTEIQDWRAIDILVNEKLKNNSDYPNFLIWINKINSLEFYINKENQNEQTKEEINNLTNDIEILELKLQQSTEKL